LKDKEIRKKRYNKNNTISKKREYYRTRNENNNIIKE
jgi:hypothetical protein